MKNGKVTADEHASAAELPQNTSHHFVVAGQLAMQPDVFDREAKLLEQAENQFQLRVDQWLAGDSPVEHSPPHDVFAIQNRNSDLPTQQFKFFAGLGIVPGLFTISTEDATQTEEVPTNSSIQRQFKMLEQSCEKTYRCGGPQTAGFASRSRLFKRTGWDAKENGCPIDADDFAQEHQKLFQHRLQIQRMRQDAGKIAKHAQSMRRSNRLRLNRKAYFVRSDDFQRRGQQRLRRTRRHSHSARRRRPEPLEQDVQSPRADRLAQNMRCAMNVSFFFPLPLARAGVNYHWAFWTAAPQLFHEPCSLNRIEFNVQDEQVSHAVRQKRLGVFHRRAVDDAILLGIQRRANAFRKIGVLREH